MINKVLLLTFLICQLWNAGFSQNLIDKNLIGVWKLNLENSNVCMVFANQNSGSITDTTGSVYYFFNYKFTTDGSKVILNKNIPIYHDEKEDDKYLIYLKNDSTLLLNRNTNEKNTQLTQGKSILSYSKLVDLNPADFIRKRSQKDLIGTWNSVFKKDTIVTFTFKRNNMFEMKDRRSGQLFSGKYNVNSDKQPMELDFSNSITGEAQLNIFVFDGPARIRIAGPKKDRRRTRFTIFGDNHYLVKEK